LTYLERPLNTAVIYNATDVSLLCEKSQLVDSYRSKSAGTKFSSFLNAVTTSDRLSVKAL